MNLLLLIFLLLPIQVVSENLKIICKAEKTELFNKNLNFRFSKIINFKNKTVENLSGNSFDKQIIFNDYQIIMINNIYNYTSSFNILTYKWLVFDENFIDTYKCKKKAQISAFLILKHGEE